MQGQRNIISLVGDERRVERCDAIRVRSVAARNEVSIWVYVEKERGTHIVDV